MNSRSRAFLQLTLVLLAWVYLIGLHWQNDGLWFQGDSPRHAANGLFWKDFLLSGSLNPQDYALRYYARYPVLSLTNYPPVFHILEAVAFAASQPSPYVAKGIVLAFALLAACYLMAWLRRWMAEEAGYAAPLLLLTPGFVTWSNAVMLNVPATALSLAGLYHARRWMEVSSGRVASRNLYLAAAFTLSAVLTHFVSGITVFIIVAWLLQKKRWDLLWNCRTLLVATIAAVLMLPFLYVAYKWAPIYVGFVTKGVQVAGRASIWGIYLKELLRLTGPLLLGLGILGVVAGIFRRRWRRESSLLVLFLLVAYIALTLMLARDSRYGLLFCIPVVCFCAMAIQSVAECLAQRLKSGEMSRTVALVITLAACVMQAWIVSQSRVPSVEGFAEAVAFVERIAPDEPVCYDGYHGGVFTFYLQAGDPGFKRRVVMGSKLLYASAIDPLGGYRQYVKSPEEVIQVLQTRGGCRWLAVEISKQSKKVPASVLLQEAVKGPEFELVRSFPVKGPGLDRIDVYRFKLDPQAVQDVDLPFPILGNNVQFKVRPIER